MKTKLKMGDKVKIITGKFRGIVDYIYKIDQKNQVAYLKKVSRKKHEKLENHENHKKKKLENSMLPIHISNVAYWLEDKKKTTKIGFQEIERKRGDKVEKVKARTSRKFKDKNDNNILI